MQHWMWESQSIAFTQALRANSVPQSRSFCSPKATHNQNIHLLRVCRDRLTLLTRWEWLFYMFVSLKQWYPELLLCHRNTPECVWTRTCIRRRRLLLWLLLNLPSCNSWALWRTAKCSPSFCTNILFCCFSFFFFPLCLLTSSALSLSILFQTG